MLSGMDELEEGFGEDETAEDDRKRMRGHMISIPRFDPEDPNNEIYAVSEYDAKNDPELITEGDWNVDGWFYEAMYRKDGSIARDKAGKPRYRTTRYRSREELTKRLVEINAKGPGTYELREDDGDWFGSDVSFGMANREPSVLGQYIPMIPGPQTRQLYWRDYFAMNAKAFEAANHNPVARRVIDTGVDFVIGRGVRWRFDNQGDQDTWEYFWDSNDMDNRMEVICGDQSTYGETMLWYQGSGKNTTVRSVDPATIYEIVTDNEDVEDVLFYHQQFAVRIQMLGQQTGPTYIIRQIPADQIDHFRINVRTGEARGRSDLFSVLGWLKMLKDLLTSEVIRADMASRMAWHVQVEGDDEEATAVVNQIFPNGRPPDPGAVLVTNQETNIQLLGLGGGGGRETGSQPMGASSAVGMANDALLTMISLGTGIPKSYLGVETGPTRAAVLTDTEPGAKRLERRQKLTERILTKMVKRVLGKQDPQVEFIFPSLVSDDRSGKLHDIQLSQGEDWVSHETASTMAARELEITTYDYADEQKIIQEEQKLAAMVQQDMQAYVASITPEQNVPAPGSNPTVSGGVDAQGNAYDAQGNLVTPGAAPGQGVAGSNGQPVQPGQTGSQTPQNGSQASRGGLPADQNPMSSSSTVRKDVKESDIVREFIRAAVLEGRRIPRMTPDMEEAQASEAEFRRQSKENLDALKADIEPEDADAVEDH
jgi:hypothetical protein